MFGLIRYLTPKIIGYILGHKHMISSRDCPGKDRRPSLNGITHRPEKSVDPT